MEAGFLDVPGGRLHYEVEGSGHPLVMIHAGIANLRMWDPQVSVLAPRYRVIRYDTRGFGETETDHVSFSNRADVAALLDALGEPSAYVLGASRGGMIALDFACERPERVDALIVAGGGVGGYQADVSPAAQATAKAFGKASEEAWEAKDWERLADLETAYWVDGPGQPPDRVDQSIRRQVHDWILATYRAEKEEGIPEPMTPPSVERIGELRLPLLVMAGELDEPGTTAACRFLSERVPGARFELMPGVAHMMNLERPETFNRLVLEFLAQVDAARV